MTKLRNRHLSRLPEFLGAVAFLMTIHSYTDRNCYVFSSMSKLVFSRKEKLALLWPQ